MFFHSHHSGLQTYLSGLKKKNWQCFFNEKSIHVIIFFFLCEKKSKINKEKVAFLIDTTSLSCPPLHPDVLHYCTPCIMRAICYLLCPPSGSRHEADFPNKIHEHISSKKANYLTNSCSYQRLYIYFFFNRFLLHWTTCMKLILAGLYDFAEMLYFFTFYLLILCLYCTAFSSSSTMI